MISFRASRGQLAECVDRRYREILDVRNLSIDAHAANRGKKIPPKTFMKEFIWIRDGNRAQAVQGSRRLLGEEEDAGGFVGWVSGGHGPRGACRAFDPRVTQQLTLREEGVLLGYARRQTTA